MAYSNNAKLQQIKEMFRSSKIEIVEDEIKLYLIDYPNLMLNQYNHLLYRNSN